MNMKPMLLAALMFAGFLGAAPLDLSSYVTSGRKDTIKNTGLIVTNVDMVGLSAAITQYVGAAASVTSVNGQTGTVTITASGLGALTNETDTMALEALSTNKVTKLFDTTGTRYIDGTGGVWQVSTVTNSAMANWHVTVISDIKNGAGATVVTNLTDEVFDDPIGVPPLSLGQYAIQNVVRGGYRWSIYRASDAKQLTVFVHNIGDVTSQYLSQNMDPPTYTNAICTAWPGGASAGQCRVTYTPIVVTISVVTSALPRVAFISDTASLLSTNGNGSALTDMTVSQVAGATDYATVTNIVLANLTTTADIRTPLVNVTTGATSTVTVGTTKRVYYVESSAQTTVTNDISALALNCTSNAEWEVWYNATSTNALTPLWDSRMTFLGGAPDMTVTGVYKFALSSPCGTIIQARQTWPTKYPWINIEIALTAGSISGSYTRYALLNATVPASTSTNSLGVAIPLGNSLVMVTCYGGHTPASPVWVGAGRGSFLSAPSSASLREFQPIGESIGTASTVYFVSPARTALSQADYIMLGSTNAITETIQIMGVFSRQLNELEISAYAAGWRP